MAAGMFKQLGEKMSGKKKDKSPDMQQAPKNRESGQEILAILREVNFKNGRIFDDESKPDQMTVDQMKNSVSAMQSLLQETPTIFDDISQFDSVLKSCAYSLRTAVKEGYRNEAEWAIRSLITGILYLRDDIPPEQEPYKDKIMAQKLKTLQTYSHIVALYGEIDECLVNIGELETNIQQNVDKYTPVQQELRDMMEDETGRTHLATIIAYRNNGTKIPDDDQLLAQKIGSAQSLFRQITMDRVSLQAMTAENNARLTQVNGFYSVLMTRPSLHNPRLTAEYERAMKELFEDNNSMLVDAQQIMEIQKASAQRIESLMNTPAAQSIFNDAAEGIYNAVQTDKALDARVTTVADELQKEKERAQKLREERETQSHTTQQVNVNYQYI